MLIGAGEIISRSYFLYKKNFGTYVKYILLSFVPALITLVMYLVSIPLIFAALYVDKGVAASIAALVVLFSFLISVAGLWFKFAFVKTISTVYGNNKPDTVINTLKKSSKVLLRGLGTIIMTNLYALWPLLTTSALYIIASLLLHNDGIENFTPAIKILFILLTFYSLIHLVRYYVRLLFAWMETAIYGAPVVKSIKESQLLVAGRWWGILWRFVAPMFLVWVVSAVATGMLMQLGTKIGGILDVILSLAAIIISILVAPLFVTAMVVLFHEAEHKS